MRWFIASAISASGFVLWLLSLRPCFQLGVSFKAFEAFVILTLPWIVVFLVISLRGWKRAVIPSLPVASAFISLIPEFNPMPVAASESGAVNGLVRFGGLLKVIEAETKKPPFVMSYRSSILGFDGSTDFEYEEEGQKGYRIAALLTPQARSCG